jgi:hypothetical protein
LWKN